ncbi:MalY/PatB family protein [Ruania zhangjianzhongii]|uniref:MalY/PatB family protein n=1 Tax=Ruania zhangjianzhongii TaxID=2603206 RepID=UPI0011C74939|nr:aminotransferase class I/II-fold pyridoxal phosphate-dependent enzyme [Ruania zhangjianzhongii]
MTHTTDFDAIEIEHLREVGSVKWSTHPEALGAFVAEMDFPPAPVITQALHEAVDVGLFGYLPDPLAHEMSHAYADWSSSVYGWDTPAERVRPLADVISGLQAAIEHFSRDGSPVILPTPAYMPFLTVPPSMGREVIQVPMARDGDRYVYDLDALDAAFRAGGHLLILCNPHNPIGRVLEREEMVQIAEVVERHGGRVFSDEIHAPLVFGDHVHVPYASTSEVAAEHTVTAASASKAWNLPGMKCAQLILSNEADAARWARVGHSFEHGAANLGVIAAIAAFTRGRPWLQDVLGYLDGNRHLLRDLLAEHLPEVGYTPPEGTYLAWLDLRELGLGDRPAQFLREKAGVALTDGTACGGVGAGFVRLNFATPRPILAQIVEQMAEAVRSR